MERTGGFNFYKMITNISIHDEHMLTSKIQPIICASEKSQQAEQQFNKYITKNRRFWEYEYRTLLKLALSSVIYPCALPTSCKYSYENTEELNHIIFDDDVDMEI